MERRRFNIGLVGSVSNGKTTLVERLSGVNTKRHAAERKAGRTVKLGYANLLLWQCPTCTFLTTTGQTTTHCACPQCPATACTVAFELSLVDAPGHSALVKTMVRGTSVMDGALVVTDVTQVPHQRQTLEHLAILEILGVTRVLVIQNKCDLVPRATCWAHWQELTRQFQGTIAAQAAVIPICAQRGLGVTGVMAPLHQMCLNLQRDATLAPPSPYQGFAILRSFDINKPDTSVRDLKGGVLGGSMVGSQPLHVGDAIEIRPGWIQADRSARALETSVHTIFAEQQALQSCSAGGLFALGTNLDPTVTKGDRLVGHIAGRPEHLPPVVHGHTLKIVYVTVESSAAPLKLAVDQAYHFLWGHAVVPGVVIATSGKHTVQVRYDHPLCTYADRCIIYGKAAATGLVGLVGFGKVQ